jgi:hypothetical protein
MSRDSKFGVAPGKNEIETMLERTDVWLMIFGIIVVVGVAGESVFGIVHWMQSRRLQAFQQIEEQQRKQDIARLENDTERAKADAAEARLQQERIKAQLSWRVLTPDIVARMLPSLSGNPGLVLLAYTNNDPEALGLAIQFSRLFAQAGWAVRAEGRTYADRLIFGIVIPDATADTDRLRAACTAGGITFTTDPVPVPLVTYNATVGGPSPALLMIGSKPPPF